MENLHLKDKLLCYHCGEECPSPDISADSKYFCCAGCKTVYEILSENKLCNYYNLEKTPGISPPIHHKKYEYLDDEKIVNRLLNFQNENIAFVSFYIPQIHCTSCIWILENLYKLNENIFFSEVNFLNKTVLIKYKKNITLKKVVELLASIGYEPQIQLDSVEKQKAFPGDKKLLYKLGIAGFCFGNIMLLSFPEYLSIDITDLFYKKLFGYLNFLLSLPVLFYSASDYFSSAFTSLRKKIININLPLSIGIAALFLRSCFEIFTDTGAGYFDSMSGLVFLLLIGRYVQQRTYSMLNFERDYKSYFPLSVIKKEKDAERSVPVSSLVPGDRIIIRNNEIIPADSILFEGDAFIDYSFISGESAITVLKPGGLIYAGGKQKGSAVELEVIKEVSQSYLTRLWNNPLFNKEKDFTKFTNTVSRYFTAGVIFIAVTAALFWLPDWFTAMNVFTAVLIVACPCALALSAPFTFGNAMKILGRNKLYVKNSLNIEEMAKTDTVVFDKTGTITKADEAGVKYFGRELTPGEKTLVKSTAKTSLHPLSRIIAESLNADNGVYPSDFKEIAGEGIEAQFPGIRIKMGSLKRLPNNNDPYKTKVHLSINDEYTGYYEIANSYREGVFTLIEELKKHYKIYLLSGDNEGEKDKLLNYFSDYSNMLFRQSPQDKLEFINKLQSEGKKVLMIGDGLNDAGAISRSDYGISVAESVSNFSPACDAILESSSITRTKSILKFSRDSVKIIYINFIVSVLYNITGLTFAVEGQLTPLIAAILMPVSSLTVVAIAAAGTSIAAKRRGLLFR